MDYLDLFRCCKRGDLDGVMFLVEQKDVDVNVRDKWDSTPLYYACLCGHESVVRYLIGVGALCEANTFDGERCLYGALTDDIRRLLTQHNMIPAHIIRRDAYDEFLRRIVEKGDESDVTFNIEGVDFHLHRCILAARSQYFCLMFSSKWRRRRTIVVKRGKVHPKAFAAVMKYIYTGRFECSLDLVQHCILIGNNCKLASFESLIHDAEKKASILQREKHGLVKVTTLVVETQSHRDLDVSTDLRELAQTTLPEELRVWPDLMPFLHTDLPSFADVCFVIEGQPFWCHKVFFTARSEYFEALLRNPFHEAYYSQEKELPVITLQAVTASSFAAVVHYLYCNQAMITLENTADILFAADMFLLPGLQRQCGVFLGQNLAIENVFNIIYLSRTFNLARLEDQCVFFMAKHLDQLVTHKDFHDLVLSDASQVTERQETDSVTIVDEIRYHISSTVQTTSEIEVAKAKLSVLEDLLEDLGIEA